MSLTPSLELYFAFLLHDKNLMYEMPMFLYLIFFKWGHLKNNFLSIKKFHLIFMVLILNT
jgi:hypothetical protein